MATKLSEWTSWSAHRRSISAAGRHFIAWRTCDGPWSIWEIDSADVPTAQIVGESRLAGDIETRDLCAKLDEIVG